MDVFKILTTTYVKFKDTDYTLKKVKKTKLVNIGINLDHLPTEMKNIENTKKRKNLFIKIIQN